jgi:hypothetical protein
MLSVLLFILGIYQDVINEDHHEFSNSGINTKFIRYVKWAGAFVNLKDNQIFELSVPHSKCGLGYIFGSDTDLMIARPEVNFREYLSSGKLIK